MTRASRLIWIALCCCLPRASHALDSTWIGPGTDFNDATNWSNGVPTGTANIAQTSPTSPIVTRDLALNQLAFTTDATPFYFDIQRGVHVELSRVGVTSPTNEGPEFDLNGGAMSFAQGAAPGNSFFVVSRAIDDPNVAGHLTFSDTDAAASGIYNSALVDFRGSSLAGWASIVNDSGGTTRFFDQARGFYSTIWNRDGGVTAFYGGSDGEFATIFNEQGGVVDLSGVTSGAVRVRTISGAGEIRLGSNQLALEGGYGSPTEISGVISGTGARLQKIGPSLLRLSGQNTYTGGTEILDGRIYVSDDANLGDPAGRLRLSQGGTLSLEGDIAMTREVSLSVVGGGVLDLAGHHLTLSGPVTGGGALQMDGAGVLTLGGANTMSGGIYVNSGTLVISSPDALGDPSNTVYVDNDSQVQFEVGGTFAQSWQIGSGGARITTVTESPTLSGTLLGTGHLKKMGGGTLTFSGANNNYRGDISLLSGGMRAGADNALSTSGQFFLTDVAGAVLMLNGYDQSFGSLSGGGAPGGHIQLGDATLRVGSNGLSTTYGGVMSGTGMLVKEGNGTLTLTGANQQTGGIRLEGGILNVMSDSRLGGAPGGLTFAGGTLKTGLGFATARTISVDSAGGIWDTVANDAEASGLLRGEGDLWKKGSGTLTLAGQNGQAGRLVVQEGTLKAGAVNALSSGGGIVLADRTGVRVQLNGYDQTVGGLSGGGASGGDVYIGNAALTVDNHFDADYNGALDGAGRFVKKGAGTFVLSGANRFSGLSTIEQGTLEVDSQLGGDLAVTGGLLTGTGTVGRLENNGRVLPGNGYDGRLRAASYAGRGDLIIPVDGTHHGILAVDGRADLSSTRLRLIGSNFVSGRYAIVTAGSVSGPFSDLLAPPSIFFSFIPYYLGQEAGVEVSEVGTTLDSLARTPNQKGVASVLERRRQGQGQAAGASQAMLGSLFSLASADEARSAYNQLSGDALASLPLAGLRVASLLADDSQDHRFFSGRYGFWGRGIGAVDRTRGDSRVGSPSFKTQTSGFQVGYDVPVNDQVYASVAGGYATTNVDVDDRFSHGDVKAVHAQVSAGFDDAVWRFKGSLAAAGLSNTMQRTISFGTTYGRVTSDAAAQAMTGRIEVARSFAPAGMALEPAMSLRWTRLHQEGFSESGPSDLHLAVDDTSLESTVAALGLRTSKRFFAERPHSVDVGLRAAWEHELADKTNRLTASFADAPDSPFAVEATPRQRDSLAVGMDGEVVLWPNGRFFAQYRAALGETSQSHAVLGGLRVLWP